MAGRVSRWFKHQMSGWAKWPLRSLPTQRFYDSNFKNLSHFLRSPEDISQPSLVTHSMFDNTNYSISSYLCLEILLKVQFFSLYIFVIFSQLAKALPKKCDGTDENSTTGKKNSLSVCFRYVKNCIDYYVLKICHRWSLKVLETLE